MSVYNFFSCGVFLSILVLLLAPTLFSLGLPGFGGCMVANSVFMFDSLSYYVLFLVLFLGIYSIFCLNWFLNAHTVLFLFMSLFFSCLCFCANHALLFWVYYELSMLPLLYLIFRDSPYSERFIAGWYFSVYLLVTSLPLILILLYLSYLNGTFFILAWEGDLVSFYVYVALSFIFFTKVPLMPFHTWLPIVHAEATSIVSIYLSGYIMKLGLLGVYRCSSFLFNGGLWLYLFVCCVFSVCFIITASTELDGKRWLAFLSLAHIMVAFLGFFVCGVELMPLVFLFCLGHGLSAGLVFGFLWLFYDVTNSRNWLLLKAGVSSNSLMFIVIFGLLSLCSFPPTLQFFCEVGLVSQTSFSLVGTLFWCLYLFFGGLVPLVLCGHVLIRSEGVEYSGYNMYCYIFYFFYLIVWCYLGIILL
uniref:NADH-ubiquinone oxidoreductase chain 4 n=1 Tax=Schyzocotyle nayarensis TaxID=1697567 RepID=A0A172WXT5_SCHNA|nr:NADH dehydrogenase subunit 4 [Schyzocotyle nayarensis]ANF28227.1 NADH dehydrogenase subunit 4 [Schyzocotyle nayarensis]